MAERRIRDRKVAVSIPGRSGGREFFSPGLTFCADFFSSFFFFLFFYFFFFFSLSQNKSETRMTASVLKQNLGLVKD